jgi:hypothetical protein
LCDSYFTVWIFYMKHTTDSNSSERRLLMPAILFGLGLLCINSAGYAERFDKRGVAIPETPQAYIAAVTSISASQSGALLTLPLDARESWALLKQVLSGLGIKPEHRDDAQRRLVTEWILWTYDSDANSGSSKPPLRGLSRSYERHRFQFDVHQATSASGASIRVNDLARQKEIDVTPDSEYTWLKWKDFPTQSGASLTFLRRLQGDFEAAMVSRVVPATIAVPRPVDPAEQAGVAEGVQPREAASAPSPAADRSEPVSAPAMPEEALETQAKPDQTRTAIAPAPTAPLAAQSSTLSTGQSRAASRTSADARLGAAETGEKAATVAVETNTQASRSAAAPVRTQGGLLVDAGRQQTWAALLADLESLGVPLQNSDEDQYMLTTEWIDSSYDIENQQFVIRSKDEANWAFGWSGKGRQRHRFQLMLIPVDQGARTMIFAYHTGFQEETDRTPDSSQTLLYWQDHKTEPRIALAFLNRLRILVNP